MNMNGNIYTGKKPQKMQTLLDALFAFSPSYFTYNEQQKSKHKINEYMTQSGNKTANQNKIK